MSTSILMHEAAKPTSTVVGGATAAAAAAYHHHHHYHNHHYNDHHHHLHHQPDVQPATFSGAGSASSTMLDVGVAAVPVKYTLFDMDLGSTFYEPIDNQHPHHQHHHLLFRGKPDGSCPSQLICHRS